MEIKTPSKATLRDAGYALAEVGLAERTRPLLWEKAKAYALKEYPEAPHRITSKKAMWVTDEVTLAVKWYRDQGGGYKGVELATLLPRLLSILPKMGILGDSTKVALSRKVGVLSKVVYLAPAWESGMVMCPHFGVCGKSCIGHSSGRMVMQQQRRNRLIKTLLWKLYPDFFLQKVKAEAFNLQVQAAGQGLIPAIRMNGSSDIRWERYGLMEDLPLYPGTTTQRSPSRIGGTRASSQPTITSLFQWTRTGRVGSAPTATSRRARTWQSSSGLPGTKPRRKRKRLQKRW